MCLDEGVPVCLLYLTGWFICSLSFLVELTLLGVFFLQSRSLGLQLTEGLLPLCFASLELPSLGPLRERLRPFRELSKQD